METRKYLFETRWKQFLREQAEPSVTKIEIRGKDDATVTLSDNTTHEYKDGKAAFGNHLPSIWDKPTTYTDPKTWPFPSVWIMQDADTTKWYCEADKNGLCRAFKPGQVQG